MRFRTRPLLRTLFLLVCTTTVHTLFAQGGCIAPTAVLSTSQSSPIAICTGQSLTFNGAASTAANGQSIAEWIWVRGANGTDTTTTPIASFPFELGGVHKVFLLVVDNAGCVSLSSDTVVVLVSPVPSFAGTTAPQLACVGNPLTLQGSATQAPMVGSPAGCSGTDNGVELIDDPAPSISTLQVVASPTDILTDLAQLGDICLEMEHSFMGDLVLTVSCPNGNSVILHQQGGGGTFLGDANDNDGGGGPIIPGACFQYCFGLDPDFATLEQSTEGGLTPNTIATSQGFAIAPGRYASVQPLTQLLGCPMLGTWTFSSSDMAGADNGYLCGWCIAFGNGPDSSYIEQGPILGTSADSSYWSGTGVTNEPSQPGTATYQPVEGNNTLTYTVVDSYGCTHDTTFVVSVGVDPVVTVSEQPDLGLVCATASGNVSYQWSYNGELIEGAAGACVTPPNAGLLTATVTNEQGCSGEASIIVVGIEDGRIVQPRIHASPVPNDGRFTVLASGVDAEDVVLRVLDMTGREAHAQRIGRIHGSVSLPVAISAAPGAYVIEVIADGLRAAERIVIH